MFHAPRIPRPVNKGPDFIEYLVVLYPGNYVMHMNCIQATTGLHMNSIQDTMYYRPKLSLPIIQHRNHNYPNLSSTITTTILTYPAP